MHDSKKIDISQFLASEEKKVTVSFPAAVHRDLKMLASAHGTTIKELLLEAYINYVVPTYHKETK